MNSELIKLLRQHEDHCLRCADEDSDAVYTCGTIRMLADVLGEAAMLIEDQQGRISALEHRSRRLKQQSLRRAATIKARNQTIRELQGVQP